MTIQQPKTAKRAAGLGAAATALFIIAAGCENAGQTEANYWNRMGGQAQTAQPASPGAQTADPAAGGGDSVSFSSLNWSFGGVDASSAAQSGVQISGLSMDADGLAYDYDADLSAWGASYEELGGLICMFVERSDGTWVGGKMDWISSSRTTRDYHNVYGGYNGWTLDGVPNPCNAAIVIITPNGSQRSNVISTTWAR